MKYRQPYEELQAEIAKLKKALEDKEIELQDNKKKMDDERVKLKKNEKLLHDLVEAAAGKIGQDFFNNIVKKLSEWLNAECVLIGQIVDYEKVKAVPLYLDGKISHDFSYDLEGSPCDITTRKGYCEYSENVIHLFPKDKILVDLDAEGYIGTALYNMKGEINGVICAVSRKKLVIPPYARDIMKIIGARVSAEIERIKTEEALKKSESELRQSNATKDKFFSIIAHDLKNPFNMIIGFTELLESNFDKYSTEKQLHFIKMISQAAENTHNLLNNLLTWSMSQQGLNSFNPVKIRLPQLINECIKLFDDIASEKLIKIHCTVPEDLYVEADYEMLSTVFRNLLSNAVKFTRKGGKVKVAAKTKNSGIIKEVMVSVEDSGIGIEPERLEKLFRIDETYSTPGTDQEKGTGLGLLLCREFIIKHDGNIHAESQPGKGSKFIFTLKPA